MTYAQWGTRICLSCGQSKPHRGRGLCSACYQRALRAGTVADWPFVGRTPTAQVVVDEVAVYRATSGDRVQLRPAERRAAVARLTRQGLTGREIAARLRISTRSVVRHRTAVRRGSEAA